MSKHKVLFVSHSHSAFLVGGVEIYATHLYEALQETNDFDPVFIARAGPPYSPSESPHRDTALAMVNGDPNQYFLYSNYFDYDYVFGRLKSKEVLVRDFRDFLLAQRPDIVHFQHTVYLGYDLIRITRNALPGVPLVCTLHEYLPICHRGGQMVRTMNDELCEEESPRRCHECFPEISPKTFYMRKRFIQSHMSLVDHFIVPCEYARDRYVDWGIPPDKIQVEPYGMAPVTDRIPDKDEDRPRDRFAFFGQLNPYKGADVLLEAMDFLGPDFDGHLTIFGANLDKQGTQFQERFEALLGHERENVTFAGPYDRSDLGALMAGIDWVVVPSIWGETGPIVVMEAFQYGRPVICSNLGGMAEKVTDRVNGLHCRRRDSGDLARAMLEAAETPGLWKELQAGIPPGPLRSMDDHVDVLSGIYKRLLAGRLVPERDAQIPEKVPGV